MEKSRTQSSLEGFKLVWKWRGVDGLALGRMVEVQPQASIFSKSIPGPLVPPFWLLVAKEVGRVWRHSPQPASVASPPLIAG